MFQNSEQLYGKLNSIFHAMIAIPMLLYGILYLNAESGNSNPILKIPGSNVAIIIFVILISDTIGYYFYLKGRFRKRLMKLIEKKLDLSARIDQFYHESIKNYFLFLLPGLIALIGYILTYHNGFTIIFLIMLFTMSFYRPSTNHIIDTLRLTGEEREIIIQKKPFPSKEGLLN